MQATVGQINGDAKLTGHRQFGGLLLAASNGEVKTLVNQGTVSKMLLEQMGLNVGNIILTKLFGDKQVQTQLPGDRFQRRQGPARTRRCSWSIPRKR